MTTTCYSEEELLALASGRRALAAAPDVEAHLASCSTCSGVIAALVAESSEEEVADLSGTSLGRYRLEGKIGAGGMGEVYRARDAALGRHVAVKVLSGPRGDDAVRRLEREARAAAAITHANVVTVHDAGSAGGTPFVVSELVDGETLRSRLDRGAIAPAEGLELAIQLARGVAAAHARGVIHRDLNPRNIVVTPEGVAKILDFGLAKVAAEASGGELNTTVPGTVVGTVGYQSPEQARGEDADARSDLFALGAIFVELLGGGRAFPGATYGERLSAVLRDPPAGLDALGELAPIVTRLLEKDPARRFRSADDLVFTLERARPDAGRRPSVVAALLTRRALIVGGVATAGAGVVIGRLLVSRGGGGRGGAGMARYHQLTFRQGRVLSARLTADGGSVVYAADWDGGVPALYSLRLDGGGARALPFPPGDVLAVSRRGELALALGRRFVDGQHSAGKLALVPLEGGEPRRVAAEVQDADFAPDGELAVVRRAGAGFRVELPVGEVLVDSDGWLSDCRVSPEGGEVAFLRHPSVNDDRGELVVVERGVGRRQRVVGGTWSSVTGVAWARGRGAGWWVTGSRSGGRNALHHVAADGSARLVAAATTRLRLCDVAPDGSALVTGDEPRMRMMVRAGAAERDLSLTDISLVTDMSADGKRIAFAELGDSEGAANGAYVRAVDGGAPQRLGDGAALAVSRDGVRVAVARFAPEPRLEIVDVQGGATVRQLLGGLVYPFVARFAGDGLLVGGAMPGRRPRWWRVSADAAPRPLTDEGFFGMGAVSPDGGKLAFVDSAARLCVVDVESGVLRFVPGEYPDASVCGFGESHVFVRGTGFPVGLRRVAVKSGVVEPGGEVEVDPPPLGRRGLDAVVVDATGSSVAYSYGVEHSRLFRVTFG